MSCNKDHFKTIKYSPVPSKVGQTPSPPRIAPIFMKDAQCAVKNEKSIFRFMRFLFFRVMVDFVLKIDRKLTNFEYKNDHI